MYNKNNLIFGKFFETYLDDKIAIVRGSNISLTPTYDLGSYCILKYTDIGIVCYSELTKNTVNINKIINDNLSDSRDNLKLSYDQINYIKDSLKKLIDTTLVQIGIISLTNCNGFNTTFNSEGDIKELEIIYVDGSKVLINGIKLRNV